MLFLLNVFLSSPATRKKYVCVCLDYIIWASWLHNSFIKPVCLLWISACFYSSHTSLKFFFKFTQNRGVSLLKDGCYLKLAFPELCSHTYQLMNIANECVHEWDCFPALWTSTFSISLMMVGGDEGQGLCLTELIALLAPVPTFH